VLGRAAQLLRVSESVWNEWYAVTSLTSFDAMLGRAYNAPTRHDAELSFDGAADASKSGGARRAPVLSSTPLCSCCLLGVYDSMIEPRVRMRTRAR
jgi:hypothetical protein